MIEENQSDIEQELAILSNAVIQRRLQAPAIFFLEMYKPLTTSLQQAVLVSVPILTPLFGAKNVHRVLRILENRDYVEALITRIETGENGENRKVPL